MQEAFPVLTVEEPPCLDRASLKPGSVIFRLKATRDNICLPQADKLISLVIDFRVECATADQIAGCHSFKGIQSKEWLQMRSEAQF